MSAVKTRVHQSWTAGVGGNMARSRSVVKLVVKIVARVEASDSVAGWMWIPAMFVESGWFLDLVYMYGVLLVDELMGFVCWVGLVGLRSELEDW